MDEKKRSKVCLMQKAGSHKVSAVLVVIPAIA
jgi:hypothetical protein